MPFYYSVVWKTLFYLYTLSTHIASHTQERHMDIVKCKCMCARDGVKAKFYKDESIRHYICSKANSLIQRLSNLPPTSPFSLPPAVTSPFQWPNFLLYRLLANWHSLAPAYIINLCIQLLSLFAQHITKCYQVKFIF